MHQSKETKLILALDLPDKANALALLHKLKGNLDWVKIGLQMFTAYGIDFVSEVKLLGFKVFLDLKLHDIPSTIAKTIQSLSKVNIDMLTLHSFGGAEMLNYAYNAKTDYCPNVKLLSVTILTSFNESTLNSLNVNKSIENQVLDLAKISMDSNIDGLVCSPHELKLIKQEIAEPPIIVTPGIRPDNSFKDEQKRVMSPVEASKYGANYIVVGRPIYNSKNPLDVILKINNDISA